MAEKIKKGKGIIATLCPYRRPKMLVRQFSLARPKLTFSGRISF
jgi:hypothetical protein